MRCPKCKSTDCQILQEVNTTGEDYNVRKGICGVLLFNLPGLLCGMCGKSKETKTTHYWLCNNCGRKWKIK